MSLPPNTSIIVSTPLGIDHHTEIYQKAFDLICATQSWEDFKTIRHSLATNRALLNMSMLEPPTKQKISDIINECELALNELSSSINAEFSNLCDQLFPKVDTTFKSIRLPISQRVLGSHDEFDRFLKLVKQAVPISPLLTFVDKEFDRILSEQHTVERLILRIDGIGRIGAYWSSDDEFVLDSIDEDCIVTRQSDGSLVLKVEQYSKILDLSSSSPPLSDSMSAPSMSAPSMSTPLMSTPSPRKPCRFHAKGKCRNGSHCRFAH